MLNQLIAVKEDPTNCRIAVVYIAVYISVVYTYHKVSIREDRRGVILCRDARFGVVDHNVVVGNGSTARCKRNSGLYLGGFHDYQETTTALV